MSIARIDTPPNAPGLTPRQERALLALLEEASITAAARGARIGERTLRRWLAQPAFADSYRAARRDCVKQATARLQHAATDAVQTLVAVMNDTTATHAARVAAARTVLEETRRAAELEDLAERVATLEAEAPAWKLGRR
jgi:hypothetical protein